MKINIGMLNGAPISLSGGNPKDNLDALHRYIGRLINLDGATVIETEPHGRLIEVVGRSPICLNIAELDVRDSVIIDIVERSGYTVTPKLDNRT